jgi:hypothetical protein
VVRGEAVGRETGEEDADELPSQESTSVASSTPRKCWIDSIAQYLFAFSVSSPPPCRVDTLVVGYKESSRPDSVDLGVLFLVNNTAIPNNFRNGLDVGPFLPLSKGDCIAASPADEELLKPGHFQHHTWSGSTGYRWRLRWSVPVLTGRAMVSLSMHQLIPS